MRKIEPYPMALSLFFIFTIFYTVCIGIKLILIQFGVEGVWFMHKIWISILPGFSGLDLLSILIGYLDVIPSLRKHYNQTTSKKIIYKIANRWYQTRLIDKQCLHKHCDCVWCRHGKHAHAI